MKALTVHQPFAEAIVAGEKTVEYRSWPTTYRGPVAIHAGLKGKRNGLKRGGFVGVVELYDCVKHGDQYHWMLRNPRRIEFISCSGRQGLWDAPAEVL
jgi:ASCH domain